MSRYTPETYWEKRYRDGRSSGSGSEGTEGQYKADYISTFRLAHQVTSVIDWGVGDGQVLRLINMGNTAKYVGVDVSQHAIDTLKHNFADKATQYDFRLPEDVFIKRDLSMSMDVLFHLPDDDSYYAYLDNLFGYAKRFVIIYSTNYAAPQTAQHVLRRNFTPDIAVRFPAWELTATEVPFRSPAPDAAGFFVYERV